jgi:hypothetical protein
MSISGAECRKSAGYDATTAGLLVGPGAQAATRTGSGTQTPGAPIGKRVESGKALTPFPCCESAGSCIWGRPSGAPIGTRVGSYNALTPPLYCDSAGSWIWEKPSGAFIGSSVESDTTLKTANLYRQARLLTAPHLGSGKALSNDGKVRIEIQVEVLGLWPLADGIGC